MSAASTETAASAVAEWKPVEFRPVEFRPVGTGDQPEQAAPKIPEIPQWAKVEEDPRYAELDTPGKLDVLAKWTDRARSELQDMDAYDPAKFYDMVGAEKKRIQDAKPFMEGVPTEAARSVGGGMAGPVYAVGETVKSLGKSAVEKVLRLVPGVDFHDARRMAGLSNDQPEFKVVQGTAAKVGRIPGAVEEYLTPAKSAVQVARQQLTDALGREEFPQIPRPEPGEDKDAYADRAAGALAARQRWFDDWSARMARVVRGMDPDQSDSTDQAYTLANPDRHIISNPMDMAAVEAFVKTKDERFLGPVLDRITSTEATMATRRTVAGLVQGAGPLEKFAFEFATDPGEIASTAVSLVASPIGAKLGAKLAAKVGGKALGVAGKVGGAAAGMAVAGEVEAAEERLAAIVENPAATEDSIREQEWMARKIGWMLGLGGHAAKAGIDYAAGRLAARAEDIEAATTEAELVAAADARARQASAVPWQQAPATPPNQNPAIQATQIGPAITPEEAQIQFDQANGGTRTPQNAGSEPSPAPAQPAHADDAKTPVTATEQATVQPTEQATVRPTEQATVRPTEQGPRADIERQADDHLANLGHLPAPNGSPSNLTREQWVEARTPEFKEKHGDWEAVAKAKMPRESSKIDDARALARTHVVGQTLVNKSDGLEATLSGNSLGKIASGSATTKSVSPRAHALAVANIDHLFENSEQIESHEDSRKGPHIGEMRRYGAAMLVDGDVVPVKITVKLFRQKSDGTRIYSVEAVDLEKGEPAGQTVPDAAVASAVPDTPIAGSKERLRQIAKRVNPKSIPLDANGEPDSSVFGGATVPESTGTDSKPGDPPAPSGRIGPGASAAAEPEPSGGTPGMDAAQADTTASSGIRDAASPANPQAAAQRAQGQPSPQVTVPAFNRVAVVLMARALGIGIQVSKFRKAGLRGLARGAPDQPGGVEVRRNLSLSPDRFDETLAHEIGHRLDKGIPATALGRRLKARVMPLVADAMHARLFGQAGKAQADQRITDEGRAVSRAWRGDFAAGDPYRDSAAELYADWISAVLIAPEWARQTAPTLWEAFHAGLADKPDAHVAYWILRDMMARAEDAAAAGKATLAGFETGRAKALTVANDKRKAAEEYSGRGLQRARQQFINRYSPVAALEGMRGALQGTSFTSRLEANQGSAARAKALMDDALTRGVWNPIQSILGNRGLEAFSEYLFLRRILDERTATLEMIRRAPEEFRLKLRLLMEETGLAQEEPALAARLDSQMPAAEMEKAAAQLVAAISLRGEKFERKIDYIMRTDNDPRTLPDGTVVDYDGLRNFLHAFNVRGYLLNPNGITPEVAARRIGEIEAEMGQTGTQVIRKAAKAFHDAIAVAVREAHRVGLISDEVWNERIKPNLDNFVKFSVVEYYKGDVDAGIRKQHGTAKDVMPVDVATVLYASALWNAIERQREAALIDRAATALNEPHTDLGAITQGNFGEMQARQREGERQGKGYLVVRRNGKSHLVEFEDRQWPAMQSSAGELNWFVDAARQASGFFSKLYTIFSPGFIAYTNLVRDTRTTIEGVGLRKWARNARFGLRAARQYRQAMLTGEVGPEIRQILEAGVVPAPSRSWGGMWVSEDEAMAMLVESAHALELARGRFNIKADAGRVAKVVRAVQRQVGSITAAQEAFSKSVAYKALRDAGMTEPDARKVARFFGVPSPEQGGINKAAAQGFFLFFGPWLQGLRAQRALFAHPKTRAGYASRLAAMEVLPKVIMWGAMTGSLTAVAASMGVDLPDDLEEFYKRVSRYKMENGTVVPLAWMTPEGPVSFWWGDYDRSNVPPEWSAVGLRIPDSEGGKLFGRATWTALEESDETTRRGILAATARYAVNSGPSVNPVFGLTSDVAQAAMGRNPDDSFTGRPRIPNDQFEAGGWDRTKGIINMVLGDVLAPVYRWEKGVDVTGMDPVSRTARRVPGLTAVVTIDNAAQQQAEGAERSADARTAAQVRLAIAEGPAGKLRATVNRLERLGDKRTPRQQEDYEALGTWRRLYWEGGVDRESGRKYSGYKGAMEEAAGQGNKALMRQYADQLNSESEAWWKWYQRGK